ncbi:MAG: DUF547 domain-containing protein [Nevskiaceae bacterium]
MRTAAFTLLMVLSFAALAAPKAELWERWAASTASKVAIDHGAWNDFLSRHVHEGQDGVNRIAYGKVGKAERAKLRAYLEALQKVAIRKFSRDEQRAYWINLYNAATVDVVLEHYPLDSILKISISPGLFAKGPWKKKLLKVEGEAVSLDDIEHRILRPIWQDPRIHYAVNCASFGCPNLQARAFTSGNTDALLDAGARAYVNHPRGASVEDGDLTVSSIYVWFQGDFGGGDAGVLAHLRQYAEPPLKKALADVRRISGHDYDWTLNDAGK